MTNQYLSILIESLQKKSKVLDQIKDFNDRQGQMFKEDRVSLEEFDRYVEEKGKLIEMLTQLDEGFEQLYERIAEEVVAQKDKYKAQIGQLQELIREVSAKGVSIQAQEERNKQLVEQFFKKEKAQVGTRRKTSAVAMNYYKNMSNTGVITPQFMDKKK